MRTDLDVLTIRPDATLREAMQALDAGRLGVALVVDADGRLSGTITDGDIRRALLQGDSLEGKVPAIMTRRYAAVRPQASRAAVLDLMRARSIRQIPVLDDDGRLRGLYCYGDLIEAQTRPNCAVIMAGGEGRRLLPLTESTPKPMLPVGDRPLLENLVRLLVLHGFRDLFISVRYLREQIEAHFGDGTAFGCRIEYLEEEKPLGTAGALALLPRRPQHPLLVLNGDLATDLDLSALMQYHAEAACLATQCVFEYVHTVPFGIVQCEADRVVAVEEKPNVRQLINAGIYVLAPSLLDLVPESGEFSMPDLLQAACRSGYPIAAFPIRERWTDIGRPDDYRLARAQFAAEAHS